MPMHPTLRPARGQRGFTLVELLVAVALGLLVMVALIAVYLNISRTNSEMYKTNGMIESGRFAVDVLNEDISHAGYWGGFVPDFDNESRRIASAAAHAAEADVPEAAGLALGPCAAYAGWTPAYRAVLVGVPLEVFDDALPTGCSASLLPNRKAGTDVLVVRHAETCLPGDTNCDAYNANKVYFARSTCATQIAGGGFALSSDPSIPFLLATTANPPTLTQRNCVAGAELRKFVSSIYYIRDWAATVGDGVPTLVRSSFGLVGGLPAHEPAQALIEGIEQFRVELGVDQVARCGTAVDYTKRLLADTAANQGTLVRPSTCAWDDVTVTNNTLPTVRGDGVPESYVRCAAAGCTAAQLRDVVAAKIYLVARSRDKTEGYADDKTYALGSAAPVTYSGELAKYKRHQFQTTVRMVNISGRRETPSP